MPLKIASCKPYYEDFITSNDVIDEVVFARSEYPVVDLCKSREYDLANVLLQKGYQCLHEDAAHDVLTILRSIYPRNISPSSENSHDSFLLVVNVLAMELRRLDEPEYRTLVNGLGRNIANKRYCRPSQNIIADIRQKLSELYTALIEYGDFPPSVLMMLDKEFVQDYLKELNTANRLTEYAVSNKVDKNTASKLLLDLMSMEHSDEIELSEYNLFQINLNCPAIFPDHFTCDVAILASIKNLRISINEMDEPVTEPSDIDFLLETSFDSFIGRLNRLLNFHMKKDYCLDCVAETLIFSCAADGTEYPLIKTEVPQLCDYYILDQVAAYAKHHFHIDKLPILEYTLETANITWIDIHSDPEWESECSIAMSEISKLNGWFYENCDVVRYEYP